MKDRLKNAFLYAYYECYLQMHVYYKRHKDKNFYSILLLGFPLCVLLEFPTLMIIDKTVGLPSKIFLYSLIIVIAYGYILLTSRFIGDDDLTEKINNFYDNKKNVKESRRMVLGFVMLSILFWVFTIKYDN